MIVDEAAYLDHAGVKGMKWGVRKEARKNVRTVGKNARSSIRQAKKAKTRTEKLAAAKRYEAEVVNVMKTKKFKEDYFNANTMGKGEMVTRMILGGPVGYLAYKQALDENRTYGLGREQSDAQVILKGLRS